MIVLDASFTLSLFLPDEASDSTREAVRILALEQIIVPSIWPVEIGNAITSAVRRQRLQIAEITEIEIGLEKLGIDVVETNRKLVFERVLPTAIKHGLSAYDAAYLELAQRTGARLATLDRKLAAAARAESIGLVQTG